MAANETTMPNENRDPESGRFASKYSEADFIEAINSLGGAAGTQEITDALNAKYDTVYSALRKYENSDDSPITSRKVANARLWQATDA